MTALLAATLTIALRYDTALSAAGFPSPVLDVVVNGRRAVLLVDTGASVHTLAKWFVDAAKLTPQPTDHTVTGSTGAVTRVDVVANVEARLVDGRLVIPQAIVADLPPLFEQHRIAGLLSPQLLAGAGEAVLFDLRRPRLSIRPDNTPPSGRDRVCVNGESAFRNRLYATAVTIAGTEASLLVDSGATRTTIRVDSTAGKALRGRAVEGGENRGVGGAVDRLLVASGVAVRRGSANAVMDVRLGTGQNACGADGLLGMDLLKGCSVLLGESSSALRCR